MNKVKNKGYNYAHTCVCDPDDGFSLSLNGASLTQQGGEGQRGRTALQHPVWLARGQKEHRARDPRPTPPEAGQTRQKQRLLRTRIEPTGRQCRHSIANSHNGSANQPKKDLPMSRKIRNFANIKNYQQ